MAKVVERADVVFGIDNGGRGRPLGKAARLALQKRAGLYRVVSGPRDVLLLARVGSESDATDSVKVRMSGEVLSRGMVCDVVRSIALAGWTGELSVVDHAVVRTTCFARGNVVGVRTTAPEERIGQLLVRRGFMRPEDVDAVLERARSVAGRERFGELSVEMGLVARRDLFAMLEQQVAEVFFASVLTKSGAYYFVDDVDDARLGMHHAVSALDLLDAAVAHAREVASCRALVSDGAESDEDEDEDEDEDDDAPLGAFVRADEKSSIARVVAAFNDVMRRIDGALRRQGAGRAFRAEIAGLASSRPYDTLFFGAAVATDGTVDPVVLERNARDAAGDAPEGQLAQWLHSYASFAVFTASSELPQEAALALRRDVQKLAVPLLPNARRGFEDRSRPAAAPDAGGAASRSSAPTTASAPAPRGSAAPPEACEASTGAPNETATGSLAPVPGPFPTDPPARRSSMLVTGADVMSLPPGDSLRPSSTAPADVGALSSPHDAEAGPGALPFSPALPLAYEAAPEGSSDPTDSRRPAGAVAAAVAAATIATALALFSAFGGRGDATERVSEAQGASPLATFVASPVGASLAAAVPTITRASEPSVASTTTTSDDITTTTAADATPSAAPLKPAAGASNELRGAGAASEVTVDTTVAPAPRTGRIRTPAPAGNRVFADGKVVGNTPDVIELSCGSHTIRVGSAGHDRLVDVPCGGDIPVTR